MELPSGDVLDLSFASTTSQDLLLDLGPPIRKYWKEDDRMARTWGLQDGARAEHDEVDGDCEYILLIGLHAEVDSQVWLSGGPSSRSGFWNYFQHGLDCLISRDGRIKRIIVHSNMVCPAAPIYWLK